MIVPPDWGNRTAAPASRRLDGSALDRQISMRIADGARGDRESANHQWHARMPDNPLMATR
ncbi:hypothetical protein CWS35_28790 [Bradyrhizobium sp. SK17]|nr:hypothetical protein CWS35_28790 [Bradyrhizobium sp. SK17]